MRAKTEQVVTGPITLSKLTEANIDRLARAPDNGPNNIT